MRYPLTYRMVSNCDDDNLDTDTYTNRITDTLRTVPKVITNIVKHKLSAN